MIKNICKHFITICKHKYWVMYYCFKAGLPWRGIKHDISKFSLIEFSESIKYYQGTSSPIDACKKEKGYSLAWQHHKGRNDHHYEYWVDNNKALIMPKKAAIEMICDFLGAGRAYSGKNFSYKSEYFWWREKEKENLKIHPRIKNFIECSLYFLYLDEKRGFKPYLKDFSRLYDLIVKDIV